MDQATLLVKYNILSNNYMTIKGKKKIEIIVKH